MEQRKIRRGQIYMAALPEEVGSVQHGERPVLIIQNNKGNEYSPTVIVAPITSKLGKRPLPTHVRVINGGLPKDSIVLFEQIRVLDKTQLGEYVGKLSQRQMLKMGYAMSVSIGLEGIKHDRTENRDGKR